MKGYLLIAKQSTLIMLFCLLILLLNSLLPSNFNQWGIVPRSIDHLSGIFFAPFLHANLIHLFSNFFPFIVLSFLLGGSDVKRFWQLFFFFIITSGLLVWLFARGNSVHIGMSGVIYAFWGYLLVYGFVRRQLKHLLISLITLFFYGGLLFGVFPTQAAISFEGHFMGALVGVLTGYHLAKR